jgi:hypothetical protein
VARRDDERKERVTFVCMIVAMETRETLDLACEIKV